MRIAVASGKGGTGKTTIATSLALTITAANSSETEEIEPQPELLFLDCDVEAPNAHLFLKPVLEQRQPAGILIPEVNEAACTGCGICDEVCQFQAIALVGERVLVFPELCHGCGSCTLNCPEGAIRERLKEIGVLEAGRFSGRAYFGQGLLNIGQPMAVPIVRQLKKWVVSIPDAENGRRSHAGRAQPVMILDAPPGSSCPVVETLRGADFALLVTEPTPFGLHDLRLMVEVVRELNIPTGVIINRDGIGDAEVERFCAGAGLPILMRIPLDREISRGLARGEPLVAIDPAYRDRFRQLYHQIQNIGQEAGR